MNITILGAGGPTDNYLINNNINIRNLGLNNQYYKTTRYNTFNEIIDYIKSYSDIKTILDIASSIGIFVYLANKQKFICEGCDIEVLDNANDIFIEEFNRKCIFKYEFDNLLFLEKEYDLICSFGLTHIFEYNAFLYLLKILSIKSKYCILHFNKSMIDRLKNECNFVTFIHMFSDNNGSFCIFLKFNSKQIIEKTYKFERTNNGNGNIILY